jgi:glycosyltransferase involved in cell wall biosynthesis
VVHLVDTLEVGSLDVTVANLAKHASGRVRVHVICLEGLGQAAAWIASPSVTVESIGQPGTSVWRSVRALRRRLKELRPDVLHTHNEKPHIRGALALAGWSGRPVLVHTRHGRTRAAGWRARMAGRLADRRTAYMVSASEDADFFARLESGCPDRLRVIRNAVDVGAFDASNYEERAGLMRALAVARLDPDEDIATMLRAARVIANAYPNFHLDIVGDGPSRPSLEALRQLLRLGRLVTFHGAQDDVRPYLTKATLFVQSSTTDSAAVKAVEAMSAGLPIVATDAGSAREVVEHGVTGTLVEPGNADALAAAVMSLLNDRPKLLSMNLAARTRAERGFDARQMTAAYESLYEEALTRPRGDSVAGSVVMPGSLFGR